MGQSELWCLLLLHGSPGNEKEVLIFEGLLRLKNEIEVSGKDPKGQK
jgi:hypothetical protein